MIPFKLPKNNNAQIIYKSNTPICLWKQAVVDLRTTTKLNLHWFGWHSPVTSISQQRFSADVNLTTVDYSTKYAYCSRRCALETLLFDWWTRTGIHFVHHSQLSRIYMYMIMCSGNNLHIIYHNNLI